MGGLLSKLISVGKALLTGENVSAERMQKRMEICSTCPLVIKDGDDENGSLRCGICGCRVSGDRTLINLTRYEETDSYGCKKTGGSEWKKAGV